MDPSSAGGRCATGGQPFDLPWLLALARVSDGALCFLTHEMRTVAQLIVYMNVLPHLG